MARRTYVPGLKFLTRQIVLYVSRNRATIDKNLSPEVRALLTALLNAAQALADALPTEPLGD